MKRSTLGTGFAVSLIAAAFVVVACAQGSDPDGGAGNAAIGGASGMAGSGQEGSGQGGSAGNPQGGSAGASGQGGGSSGATGQGGSSEGGSAGSAGSGHAGEGGGGGECTGVGQWASVQDIAMGVASTGTQVWIEDAVAESPIVLTYKSGGGNCLWAVFVRDPSQDYATMVISYGDPAPKVDGGTGDCPKTGTLFPDNLAPGDRLSITGTIAPYAPSTCSPMPTKQVQVEACAVSRTSSGTPPTPVTVTPSAIVNGDAKYQSLLVKIENVDAETWPDGGAIGPYGVIKLAGSGLEVHDKFYYTEDGAPAYPEGQHFTSITGIVHLDYCTWALQPLDKCTDIVPKSTDCN